MMDKLVLVILRHENSLRIVDDFLRSHNVEPISVALDPVEMPDGVDTALENIRDTLQTGVDAIVIGTKVYDHRKREKTDPPEQLIDFLELLKDAGAGQTPICMTHLSTMPSSLIAAILETGLNTSWVENDNLKNDGMNNLGPLLLKALA